jgi:predicted dehydrogenase
METGSTTQNFEKLYKDNLNWGVLGTARIAAKAVIPALKASRRNVVTAIASRDLTRAQQFAQTNGIQKAYGSYEELIRDPEIDAVYIPLPNSEHAPWAIKAMEAGKHVLVEKPFALNADAAQLMVATSLEHSVLLMEAFMYRYHSRFEEVMDIVQGGSLGQLRFIQSTFSFQLTNPNDYRLSAPLGGGALYDLGCYCVNFQRLLVGREPRRVQALSYMGSTNVDLQMSGTLDFGEQVFTHFDVAFNAAPQQYTRIIGTEGVLSFEKSFNPGNEASEAYLHKGSETKRFKFKREDAYQKMVEHFYNVVASKEAPRFPLSDAVNNLVVMDALFQSAASGGNIISLIATNQSDGGTRE